MLLLFASGPASLGVSEIGRRLGLSKAVVYRILRSLVSRQLLAFDAGKRVYRLGPAATALGARALRDLDLRGAALPELRRLQRETGETATVSQLVGTSRVYLDQVPSSKEIKMTVEVGRPFPLHAGSSGRAILAFSPPELMESILAGPMDTLTPLTIDEPARLEVELARVRRDGTARSFGERQAGAGSVAAPILGSDGFAIGSLSVCGPVGRFDEETVSRICPFVEDAARTVSRRLA